MNILRTTYYNIITVPLLARAVAMSLFVKKHIRSSAVNNFSYNKLHILTGLHINTCKAYVKALRKHGLAEFVGKGNSTLVFKRLHSRHGRKNVDIGEIVGDSVKEIAYQLYAIFNVEIVKHKEFAKHIIATAVNGYKHVKTAKRKARKYGYGREFIENGLALKTIAKKLKCGLQKAQNIIKFCVKYGFLNKHHNIEQIYDQQAQLRYACFPDEYTFATKNNLYIVKANSYTLGNRYTEQAVGWLLLDDEK